MIDLIWKNKVWYSICGIFVIWFKSGILLLSKYFTRSKYLKWFNNLRPVIILFSASYKTDRVPIHEAGEL